MSPTATIPSANDALSALNSYQQPDSGSVLAQAQQQYGVQGAQDRVNTYKTLTNNLTGAIAAVDPSVTGRTAGSLVTEGQRSALVNRERAPIIGELGTANNGLSAATNDYNTADTNAKDATNMKIADNKSKYDQLLQTYNIASSRENAAAQAAADAAKQQESVREFNVGQANENARSAASRSTATKPAQTMAAVQQHVTGQLAGNTGKDGYVSNQTFAAALNDYQAAGGTVRSFWQQYGRYANPKYQTSYAGWKQR